MQVELEPYLRVDHTGTYDVHAHGCQVNCQAAHKGVDCSEDTDDQ